MRIPGVQNSWQCGTGGGEDGGRKALGQQGVVQIRGFHRKDREPLKLDSFLNALMPPEHSADPPRVSSETELFRPHAYIL